jgi:hypothetical protein
VAVVQIVAVEDETPVLDERDCLEEGVGRAALIALYEIPKGQGAKS